MNVLGFYPFRVTRNPDLFPKLRRRVLREGLKPYLADNCQWDMNADGRFDICSSRRARICAQDLLLAELATHAE